MPRAQQPQAQADEWGDEIGSGTFISWTEPKVVIGTFVKAEEDVPGKYGPSYQITLVLDSGETVLNKPPSALESRMRQIPLGSRVRIEYDGTTTPSKSGQPVKNFSVRVSKNSLHAEAFKDEIPV